MTPDAQAHRVNPWVYLLLAASTMAYGWGYRGTVGHEGGAMVPGALLGLVLCLGSGRLDWYRRTAVVGLFAAVGWAWGGSLSYMEQTFYVTSDSRLDVLYGYAMLFFLGAIWAGIGGGVMGLALTESRSELRRFVRPFTALAAAYLVVYLYFFFMPAHNEAYVTFTVRHFHDGDWLPALIAVIVAGAYWAWRPADRHATELILFAAVGWWIGYLVLTKFGGLRLGPLHRSESWGGVLGILVVLLVYLARRANWAAFMLSLYGIVGGGLAFAFAVFFRHPLVVNWGPFQGRWPQWRIAEDTFGFFMAVAIGLGVLRLIRGGLAPADEDTRRTPLDVYAVFVLLVALIWINFRRHAEPWIAKSDEAVANPFLGIPAWGWFVAAGALATGPVLFGLYRYAQGHRDLVPPTAFGKGLYVTLALLGLTLVGYTFDDPPNAASITGHLVLWVPVALTVYLLLGHVGRAEQAVIPSGGVPKSDPCWKVGPRYWGVWAAAALCLVAFTELSMAMQDGPHPHMGRMRFGEDAYWRQTARMLGTWEAQGMAQRLEDTDWDAENRPIVRLEFDEYRNVQAANAAGERTEAHRWFLKNQYTWLHWYGKEANHAEQAEVPLQFRDNRIYIQWPPATGRDGYLVFERVE